MVGVAIGPDSSSLVVLGHGLLVEQEFELERDVYVSPIVPKLDLEKTVAGCKQFSDYAAVIYGSEIATFSIRIEHEGGGEALAVKGWNSLWIFHLLSVACRAPCLPLYSVCDGRQPLFSAASPSPFIRAFGELQPATTHQLEWARQYSTAFDELVKVSEFSAALRSYANSYLLPEHDVRIMLLWAGIEGLLSVDAELSRRLALYAAILMDGTPNDKAAFFDEVKKAYGVRSRAVHGSELKDAKMKDGYQTAGRILIGLLARCVELGRVPSPNELDKLAVSASLDS